MSFKKRESLWKKSNGRCYYCNCSMKKPIWNEKPVANTCTIEHTVSRSNPLRGFVIQDLVAVCYQCNQKKSAEDQKEYKMLNQTPQANDAEQ